MEHLSKKLGQIYALLGQIYALLTPFKDIFITP